MFRHWIARNEREKSGRSRKVAQSCRRTRSCREEIACLKQSIESRGAGVRVKRGRSRKEGKHVAEGETRRERDGSAEGSRRRAAREWKRPAVGREFRSNRPIEEVAAERRRQGREERANGLNKMDRNKGIAKDRLRGKRPPRSARPRRRPDATIQNAAPRRASAFPRDRAAKRPRHHARNSPAPNRRSWTARRARGIPRAPR